MSSIYEHRVMRVADTIDGLIQLASSKHANDSEPQRARDMSIAFEDSLYDLTGMFLDLFRLDDQRHGSCGEELHNLLVARRQLTQSMHGLLEAAGSMRTCTVVTSESLLADLESLSLLFRDYRETSLRPTR